MFEEIETIYMWAEYGNALFWHKGQGCCGDSRSIITRSKRVIDLSGIYGLKEWYARYDDDRHPAYEWSPEEYNSWNEEGQKYALAVRGVLPDIIDLVYGFGNGDSILSVPRKGKVVPSKPFVSNDRLEDEITDLMWRGKSDIDPYPFIDLVNKLCEAIKYEEMLEDAHCWWDDSKKTLVIQWYLRDLYCRFCIHRESDEDKFDIEYEFSEKMGTLDQGVDIIEKKSSMTIRNEDDFNVSDFVEWLYWYLIERGLK